jgi:CRP-like cAMP-binding protein
MVMERCELKHLLAGDIFLEAGKPVAGLAIVGAGRLELVNGDAVVGELHAGDLVFPNDVLSHGRAPHTVRAGKQGALVLATSRMAAHELMVSVPPLLELLAG